MAFNRDGWNPIGGQSKKGKAPQLFTYITTDAVSGTSSVTDVRETGYFNDVASDLTVGDIIISVTSTGGTLASTIHTVVSNTGTVVDLSDGTTITQTDSGDG
jgi:hypothetical protein